MKSFNPCFPGTRSSTQISDELIQTLIAFQSLFSWNSLFDPPPPAGTPSPYLVSILVFLELALRLDPPYVKSTRGSRFQSLFSWNSLFDPSGAWTGSRAGYVSILVFLELALRQNTSHPPQPPLYIVSILVFLELALRPHIEDREGWP